MIHIVCWCGHNKRYITNNYKQEKQQNISILAFETIQQELGFSDE